MGIYFAWLAFSIGHKASLLFLSAFFGLIAGVFFWIAYKIGWNGSSMYEKPRNFARWGVSSVLLVVLIPTLLLALNIGAYFWAGLCIVALCFWSYLSFKA